MTDDRASSTETLIRRAGEGDASAIPRLLTRHQPRLRRMIAIRLDPRLAARVDPSDVVQEALADAARRLPDYVRQPSHPFYPWLRMTTTKGPSVVKFSRSGGTRPARTRTSSQRC